MTDYALLRQILNSLGFHSPENDDQRETHAYFRNQFIQMGIILASLPPGRERALAITKLEESAMWAHKALALEMSPVRLDELDDITVIILHDIIVGHDDPEYPRDKRISEIETWLKQATRFGLNKGPSLN